MPNNITIYSLDEILSLANIVFDNVTEIKVKAIQNNVESDFAYMPACNAPVISLNGTTLSWPSVSGANSYIVYVDNIVNTIIATTNVNVSTLSYYTTATHTIKVKASRSDGLNSIFSNSINYYHEANETGCLTFSSANTFTLGWWAGTSAVPWDGTIEYSTNKSSWNTWTGQNVESISDGSSYKVYLRGTNNTIISRSTSELMLGLLFKFTGTDIACSGNIESLLDYQTVMNGQHPQMAAYCFNSIFANCTNLISAPSLPATTLSIGCYANMFSDCTSLTNIPALPATTLTEGCYYCMFDGCSNIKLSTTQTGIYQNAYRIPTSGTGTVLGNSVRNMFLDTGGTFVGDPSINTTYYISNMIVPAS